MKRFRFQFSRGEKLKYLSHLDMMRLWPRLFRRAGIEMAYSEGFNAHPRIAVAAPLAVGWTGESELMDIWIESPLPATTLLNAVAGKLPEHLSIGEGMFVPSENPSLQSQVRFAEYKVDLALDRPVVEIEHSIDKLLEMTALDWTHQRDEETRHYDLRAQIENISILSVNEQSISVLMLLKNDPSGSGRPEQVSLALGFRDHPLKVHRTRLVLA